LLVNKSVKEFSQSKNFRAPSKGLNNSAYFYSWMKDIVWFKNIKKEDINSVGGKGANLGELFNMGLPIPPGFCISVKAYDLFLKKSRINKAIEKILKSIDVDNAEDLQKKAEEIQEIILDANLPIELAKEIEDAYNNLDVNIDLYKIVNKSTLNMIRAGRTKPYVAIRSSATAEDLPEASFAGQQETYLNVRGGKNVINAVIRCFASLFTARAIYYRKKNSFDSSKVKISVVVQKMINSEKRGVMFSINPSTNNNEEIVIESGFGLGEAVVSGAINPDNYIVQKKGFKIKQKKINRQTWMFTRDENLGRTVKRKITASRQQEQVLNNHEIIALSKIGEKIEKHYGKPMDIEFAVENNRIYILQARRVTAIKKVLKQDVIIKEGIKQLLKGLAASRGIVSGPVKIVKNINELDNIRKGDILVAKMTNPDYVMAMQKAGAIVTDEGGLTSHAAIVSREMRIPCVVGTNNATKVLKQGQIITVDADDGVIYDGRINIKKKQDVNNRIEKKTRTKIKVICDLPDKAIYAAETGAEGVGLVRIEFIIAENGIHPFYYLKHEKDKEYTNILVKGLENIAEAFKGKPVWVRTSDIRSDEYRNLKGGDLVEEESNPMLGWHGIRMGLDETRILKAEFEAIKELHEKGYNNIGVMLPFVTSVDEVRKAKDVIRNVGLEPVTHLDFGVMIETPASVWIIDELCKEGISFISFGTNDLTQTTLGIDRNNEKIQERYNEMNIAVLREIKHVIEVCKNHHVETSICGQAGSYQKMVEFLVKHGIDSISANIDAVGKVSREVARVEEIVDSKSRSAGSD